MKRYLLPLAAGVVVFGGAAAFAASLTVSGTSLGAASASVSACNANANVTYNTVYSAAVPGYKVGTAPVSSANSCATKSYKVTLQGGSGSSLAEIAGTLDNTGAASPDFTTLNIAASAVVGVSVVIAG